MTIEMVSVTIEGVQVTVPKGTSIIEAAKQAGVLVPHYCYHPSLPSPARPASVLVALVLALAVLGFWSSDPRLAGVAFLNILGGLGLVSFSWRVVLASTPDALLTAAVGGQGCLFHGVVEFTAVELRYAGFRVFIPPPAPVAAEKGCGHLLVGQWFAVFIYHDKRDGAAALINGFIAPAPFRHEYAYVAIER